MNLSVALCTYNGADYLRPQLDSILAQTRIPDEIVVCDDASTDETPAILRAYARRHPDRITVHHNDETLGVTKNFEKAISSCSGDLVAVSDQDDVWHEEKLERGVRELQRTGADLVFHDSRIVSESLEPRGRLWDRHIGSFDPSESRSPTEMFAELARRNVVQGATMLFRAACRETVLPIPERWQYDHYIALLIAATGRLHPVDEPLLQYRQHETQDIGAHQGGAFGRLIGEIRDRFEIDGAHLRTVADDWRALTDVLSTIDEDRFVADANTVRNVARRKARYAERRSAVYEADRPKLRRLREVAALFASNEYDGFANRFTSAPKDALVVLFG